MASVNKVILIGRLGQNPEVRYTTNGGAVANFSLATNEYWTDKNNQKQEKTDWHRIVAFGKLGEICGQYLSKGRQAYIEGRLQTRDWVDKEGVKKYTTEIIAQVVQFLSSPGEKGSSDFAGSGSSMPEIEPAAMASDKGAGGAMADDEVPF